MKRYSMGEPRISDGEPDCDMVEAPGGGYLDRDEVLDEFSKFSDSCSNERQVPSYTIELLMKRLWLRDE